MAVAMKQIFTTLTTEDFVQLNLFHGEEMRSITEDYKVRQINPFDRWVSSVMQRYNTELNKLDKSPNQMVLLNEEEENIG